MASPESQLGLGMAERAASAAWWISIPGSRVLQRPRPRPAPSSLFGTLRSVSHRPLLASAVVARRAALDRKLNIARIANAVPVTLYSRVTTPNVIVNIVVLNCHHVISEVSSLRSQVSRIALKIF